MCDIDTQLPLSPPPHTNLLTTPSQITSLVQVPNTDKSQTFPNFCLAPSIASRRPHPPQPRAPSPRASPPPAASATLCSSFRCRTRRRSLWYAEVSKETCVYSKRDLHIQQKRPAYTAKETYVYSKRGLLTLSLSFRRSVKRDLRIQQKRPTYTAQVAY